MSALFYSVKEAAQKLNKTEDEVKTIAEEGVLREFRHGTQVLFKRDDVEAMVPGTDRHVVARDKVSSTKTIERPTFELILPDFETDFHIGSPQANGAECIQAEQEDSVVKPPADTGNSTEAEKTSAGDEHAGDSDEAQALIDPELVVAPGSTMISRSTSPRLSGWQWFVTGLQYDRPGPILLLFAGLCDIAWRCAAVIYVASAISKLF